VVRVTAGGGDIVGRGRIAMWAIGAGAALGSGMAAAQAWEGDPRRLDMYGVCPREKRSTLLLDARLGRLCVRRERESDTTTAASWRWIHLIPLALAVRRGLGDIFNGAGSGD
jgi:hypothetical protein